VPGVADVRLPLPGFTASHVHDLTRRILAESQFHQPPKPWPQRASDWIGNQIARLFEALSSGGSAGLIAWVIVGVAVVIAAVLIRRFARRVKRDPGVETQARPVQRRTAADWAALAEAHRRSGEWKEAVRCEYRALVATLAERGVVDEVPGRTAREYERLVGVDEFDDATELFEAVWYGNAATGEGEDKRLRDLGHRVLAAAGER
jgi:hypothetical protein